MKVDTSQFRKRPTFDEVANIVNADAYKIDLPSRTYVKFNDTQAAVEWDNFRDYAQGAELRRAQQQMAEATQRVAMPPPARRRAAVTVVAPGEGPIDQFLGSGDERGQRRRRQTPPPADVVMRDASRDDEQDPDA